MPRAALIVALAFLAACAPDVPPDVPPLQRFYFPTGVAHVSDASGGAGTLVVATSNFDKRYDFGAVTAVPLEPLGLPAVDATPAESLVIEDLKLEEQNRVFTTPFAGEMATFSRGEAGTRIFVPARSEGDNVFVVDLSGEATSCFGLDAAERYCTQKGLSLTEPALQAGEDDENGFAGGLPRAPEPYAVAIRDQEVYVTHLQQADSPVDSRTNQTSYVVKLDAADPSVQASSFVGIGTLPAAAVAVGQRYVYLGGRSVGLSIPPALRLIDKTNPAGPVRDVNLQGEVRVVDTRSVVLRPDESRVYVLARSPDLLLVADIRSPTGDAPGLNVVRAVPLPEGPTQAVLIDRGAGRAPLIAITCTSADSLAVYDDDTGQLATLLQGIGRQPYGIAVHRFSPAPGVEAARLFVSNFGDGRIAVVNMPDVNQPFRAAVVAHLGESQLCLTDDAETAACVEAAE